MSVVDEKYAREQSWTAQSIADVFGKVSGAAAAEDIELLAAGTAEQYIFWDLDDSAVASAPVAISKLLSADSSSNIFLKQTYDNFVQGGVVRTDIRSSKTSINTSYPIEAADVTVVADEKIFKAKDVLKSLKTGGKLIVKLAGAKEEDVEKKIPAPVRRDIQARKIELHVLDTSASPAVEKHAALEAQILELAFLKVAASKANLEKLSAINGSITEVSADLETADRKSVV